MGSDVKVSIKKKSGGKMKLRRMTLKPASNGVVSTMEHEPDGDEGGMYRPSKDTETAHTSMAHLVKHIKQHMGSHFGSEPSAETPNTGGAPGSKTDEEDEG